MVSTVVVMYLCLSVLTAHSPLDQNPEVSLCLTQSDHALFLAF